MHVIQARRSIPPCALEAEVAGQVRRRASLTEHVAKAVVAEAGDALPQTVDQASNTAHGIFQVVDRITAGVKPHDGRFIAIDKARLQITAGIGYQFRRGKPKTIGAQNQLVCPGGIGHRYPIAVAVVSVALIHTSSRDSCHLAAGVVGEGEIPTIAIDARHISIGIVTVAFQRIAVGISHAG